MPINRLDRPTIYGSRAKLGVIIPPTNTANEVEWHRLAPSNVSVHSTRMPLHVDVDSDAGRSALHDDLVRATNDLAQASCDVIAYGCTAGSMTIPAGQLADFMSSLTGTRCVTTAQSLVEALATLNVRRVSVATPYHDALNRHEAHFLAGHGFEVASVGGMGYGAVGPLDYRNIARVSPDEIFAFARDIMVPEAEALLISCTDLATLDVIERLEQELGRPVISSNQATFWFAIRCAKVFDSIPGAGCLLMQH